MIGLATTMRAAVDVLAIGGRAASVGISEQPIELVPFAELATREAELIGVADHHIDEIILLLDMAVKGNLVLNDVVTNSVRLDAAEVNSAMDAVESYRSPIRTVIVP
jgi:D-arabinose 1-dehydrogenase-like Zn-dependent alcohol dehydrogenase